MNELNFSNYIKASNSAKFILEVLATVNQSCINDSLFRISFTKCIQEILKETPILVFYVITQNELLNKSLIYELISSIDKKKSFQLN